MPGPAPPTTGGSSVIGLQRAADHGPTVSSSRAARPRTRARTGPRRRPRSRGCAPGRRRQSVIGLDVDLPQLESAESRAARRRLARLVAEVAAGPAVEATARSRRGVPAQVVRDTAAGRGSAPPRRSSPRCRCRARGHELQPQAPLVAEPADPLAEQRVGGNPPPSATASHSAARRGPRSSLATSWSTTAAW